MKFLDKVKNMFTEEVEEEPKKEEVKIEQIIPTEKKETDSIDKLSRIKEYEVVKEEKKPVFFTDDDFNDLDNHYFNDYKENKEKKVEVKKEKTYNIEIEEKNYKNNDNPVKSANEYLEKFQTDDTPTPYQGNTREIKKEPKFKPTPIISPVYGILDKNYHKEDIVEKRETSPLQSADGLSVDSIRKKAYGTLEDELENTLFGSNSVLFNEKKDDDFFNQIEEETKLDKKDNDLRDLEDITMDIGKELDNLLNKDKSEDDYKYDSFDDDDDLFNLIDTMYDGDDFNE